MKILLGVVCLIAATLIGAMAIDVANGEQGYWQAIKVAVPTVLALIILIGGIAILTSDDEK